MRKYLLKNFFPFTFYMILTLTLTGCINSKDKTDRDFINKQIKEMSVEEKIGQMLMFGLDEGKVDIEAEEFIKEHHIGGIILNKYNIKSSDQLLQLNNKIKQLNTKTTTIPIFISVDEEGGVISRMPAGIKNLPDSKVIGDKNNSKLAYQVGEAIGERVAAFGFNMTHAPVLDINSNAQNPIIGKRAFGSNEKTVSNIGIAEMKGIQSKNIIPVIKHFPGHGDTVVDSHKELPVVNHDMSELKKMELVPFKKAIKQNADMTMVAHILMQKIDQGNPSSLSRKVVTDLLRNTLHFNGVVITDDLTMGAILKNYDIGEAAVKAIKAGNDIVLVCHGYENKIRVINSIQNAVKEGDITEKQINESVYRILKLKEKYHLNDKEINKVDLKKINKSSENIYHSVGNKE
ncbi:beta-N-acetylhexosaminidase [Neobacillus sp. NPDC097160]|uniref:beta-N-acetylhexosaminidase n=1 Tax=Neobacillus sp. NPDC097160 TaxID=3364298 RepID=UPI00382B7220